MGSCQPGFLFPQGGIISCAPSVFWLAVDGLLKVMKVAENLPRFFSHCHPNAQEVLHAKGINYFLAPIVWLRITL